MHEVPIMMTCKTMLYSAGAIVVVSYLILLYWSVNKRYFDHYS